MFQDKIVINSKKIPILKERNAKIGVGLRLKGNLAWEVLNPDSVRAHYAETQAPKGFHSLLACRMQYTSAGVHAAGTHIDLLCNLGFIPAVPCTEQWSSFQDSDLMAQCLAPVSSSPRAC